MSDNTTKIVLHVDNNTGQVVKAEQEDSQTGARTEVSGNFNDITLKQGSSKTQLDFRVGEPAPDDDDDETSSSASASANAPKV
jgi:hypothetical protein